jgi:hypothetical protein
LLEVNVFSRHKIKSPYVTAFINTSVPTENDKTRLLLGLKTEKPLVLSGRGWLFLFGGGGLLNNAVTIRDWIASNYLLTEKSEKICKQTVMI